MEKHFYNLFNIKLAKKCMISAYFTFLSYEEEVRAVLGIIEGRLKDPEDIGFYSYGKLAAYLVMIKHVIGFDYTQCSSFCHPT